MIKDRIENIGRYEKLLPSLRKLDKLLKAPLEEMDGFLVNRKSFMLFLCEEGEGSAATTWRESEYTKEVTAAVRLGKGDFILFLPAERYLVKSEGRILFTALE